MDVKIAPSDVKRELDSSGNDSGIELETIVDDSEPIREPFDPRLIDVTTEIRTLDSMMKRLKVRQIELDPDFQRSRGIWTPKKKSLLIESLLLRIPLPTFYVAEIASGDDLGDNSWAVVDGIQRLSTIAEFVSPEVLDLSPLRLQGLEYLKDEEGKTFDELSTSLQLRILESQFTIQVIRRSTPEAVKLNIFARINTGGIPLSGQELRNALTPGPVRQLLRDMANSSDFQTAVDSSVSSSRMADREMGLRYIAFRLNSPALYKEADFDNFLRLTMKQVNDWSEAERKKHFEEFSESMRVCREVFGRDAFRKRYAADDPRRPVSKALFEVFSVGVASIGDKFGDEGLEKLVKNSSEVRERFMALMNDKAFERSISQGTGNAARVRLRFKKIDELLEESIKAR